MFEEMSPETEKMSQEIMKCPKNRSKMSLETEKMSYEKPNVPRKWYMLSCFRFAIRIKYGSW